jgi:hypothetical protein
MGQSRTSKSDSRSCSQEILSILWIPKVNYRANKNRPLVPVRGSWDQSTSILILNSHLHLSLPNRSYLISLKRATCPAHLIILNFTAQVVKLFSLWLSLCYCHFSFFEQNISSALLFLCTFNIFYFFRAKNQASLSYKTTGNITISLGNQEPKEMGTPADYACFPDTFITTAHLVGANVHWLQIHTNWYKANLTTDISLPSNIKAKRAGWLSTFVPLCVCC